MNTTSSIKIKITTTDGGGEVKIFAADTNAFTYAISELKGIIPVAFLKITMSGDINDDRAVEIIMRDNPHFFRQPSENELRKSFHAVMNDEIRSRAQQSNRLADDIFSNVRPTDKPR